MCKFVCALYVVCLCICSALVYVLYAYLSISDFGIVIQHLTGDVVYRRYDRLCGVAALAHGLSSGYYYVQSCMHDSEVIQLESALSGIELGEDGNRLVTLWSDIKSDIHPAEHTKSEMRSIAIKFSFFTRSVRAALIKFDGLESGEVSVFDHLMRAAELRSCYVACRSNPHNFSSMLTAAEHLMMLDFMTCNNLPTNRLISRFMIHAVELHQRHNSLVKSHDISDLWKIEDSLMWLFRHTNSGTISTLAFEMESSEDFPDSGTSTDRRVYAGIRNGRLQYRMQQPHACHAHLTN